MSKEDNKKVRLRTQEDATKRIVKHLEKAQKQSKIDLEPSDIESLVAPIVSELYEAYEQEGTLPTLQGFADKCENADVAEVILAIDKDPFIKRSHKALILVLLLLIACVVGYVAYTSYYTTDIEEEAEEIEAEEDEADEEEEEETVEEESEEEVDVEATEEVTSEDSSEDSTTESTTASSSSSSGTSSSNTSSSGSSGSTSSNTSSSSSSSSNTSSSSSSNSGSSSSNTSSSSSTTTHTHSFSLTSSWYECIKCANNGGSERFYDSSSLTAHLKAHVLSEGSSNGSRTIEEYTCSCGLTRTS